MLANDWIENYILLALRMDRAFQQVDAAPFLDTYYGPEKLKTAATSEAIWDFRRLADQASSLLDRLPSLNLDLNREIYLAKHVEALETIARIKSGEAMPFFLQLEKVFDIQPDWIPEQEFEESLSLLDQALPGKGALKERYSGWLESIRLPLEKTELVLPIMELILAEARKRTDRIVPLPEGEVLDLEPRHGINYGAANWYRGMYRSRLELNLDRPVYPFLLLYQMCHEGYPGHHTESCLKELHIYREKGFQEQSVFFSLGPQLLIAEGIASLAPEMIFNYQEAADWLQEEILPLVGNTHVDGDLALILKAFSVVSPDDLSSNLATLIEAGRSMENILEYAMTYSAFPEAQLRSYLPWLDLPLARLYAFTYSHGKRLIRPFLEGPQRNNVIRRLLTEQVVPSRLYTMSIT